MGCLGSYWGAQYATSPFPAKHPPAKKFFNHTVEDVTVITKDSVQIAAWYLPNSKEKSVILMNGYRGNRVPLVNRAKLYYDKGFSVLMPDLRGTGESDPVSITFGWKERFDLQACTRFLQNRGHERIAVHGLSLGAATIAYSLQEEPDYWFAVLESCYNNIDQTFQNRLDMFFIPSFSSTLVRYFTEQRIGALSTDLSPEEHLKAMKCPVLFLAGDKEKRVKKKETESIFNYCGAKDKQLHFFKGARHQDFLAFDREQFILQWATFVENCDFSDK